VFSIAFPKWVFFEADLSSMAAPKRCIEAMLHDVFFFHFWLFSLFKVIRALSTTFAPKE
jgi:hypothetical protein